MSSFTISTPYPKTYLNRAILWGVTAGNYISVTSLSGGFLVATEPGFPRLYVVKFFDWVYAPSSKTVRLEQIFDQANCHAFNAGIEIDYHVDFTLIMDTDLRWRLHMWSGAPASPSNRADLTPLSGYWSPP